MICRWFKRALLVLAVLGACLLAPVARTELACNGATSSPLAYQPIVAAEHQRGVTRTFMTYPEWHIVHAYDDYAEVISNGPPHAFAFLQSVRGYWSSLCSMKTRAQSYEPVDGDTKLMVYTIGVSFTAELLAKAFYEETVGRIVYLIAGRGALDDLSARQARDYARFLQQVPWYQWDFQGDRGELADAKEVGLRNSERRLALSLEYSTKAAYANVIAGAVQTLGYDDLRLRMVIRGLSDAQIAGLPDVTLIERTNDRTIIETPRYRVLTGVLDDMAKRGAEFVEIAGNVDIMLTAISSDADTVALFSFPRQGYGDFRHLILLGVPDLAAFLRGTNLRVEHIHDY